MCTLEKRTMQGQVKIVEEFNVHSHPSSKTKIEFAKVRAGIKRKMGNCQANISSRASGDIQKCSSKLIATNQHPAQYSHAEARKKYIVYYFTVTVT